MTIESVYPRQHARNVMHIHIGNPTVQTVEYGMVKCSGVYPTWIRKNIILHSSFNGSFLKICQHKLILLYSIGCSPIIHGHSGIHKCRFFIFQIIEEFLSEDTRHSRI